MSNPIEPVPARWPRWPIVVASIIGAAMAVYAWPYGAITALITGVITFGLALLFSYMAADVLRMIRKKPPRQ